MNSRRLQDLARRFERRCLRPLLRRCVRRRVRDERHEAARRLECRLDLLERLLRESLGLQYIALGEAGSMHRFEEQR